MKRKCTEEADCEYAHRSKVFCDGDRDDILNCVPEHCLLPEMITIFFPMLFDDNIQSHIRRQYGLYDYKTGGPFSNYEELKFWVDAMGYLPYTTGKAVIAGSQEEWPVLMKFWLVSQLCGGFIVK
jgi:hypothetical protein